MYFNALIKNFACHFHTQSSVPRSLSLFQWISQLPCFMQNEAPCGCFKWVHENQSSIGLRGGGFSYTLALSNK